MGVGRLTLSHHESKAFHLHCGLGEIEEGLIITSGPPYTHYLPLSLPNDLEFFLARLRSFP